MGESIYKVIDEVNRSVGTIANGLLNFIGLWEVERYERK
jgi:hypothetical protein